MALTQPFINTISAFDANVGTRLTMCVLGGDAITGYNFQLLTQGDEVFYTSELQQVQNDIANASIRQFSLTIPANAGTGDILLTNNNQYKIRAITYNGIGESQTGNSAVFQCYVKPSTYMEYLDMENGLPVYKTLADNSILPAYETNFKFIFVSNDINSKAQPNILSINIYGIDKNGNRNLISSDNNFYKFTSVISIPSGTIYSAEFNLAGFVRNVNEDGSLLTSALYTAYEIEYSVRTIENMELVGDIVPVYSYYKEISNSPNLILHNLCSKGVVEITCEGLTSFNAIVNPYPPIFIDGEEVDLTATDAWAQWASYFALNSDYTLNLWARNLNDGIIAQMTSSNYTQNYVTIKYNVEDYGYGDVAFISLDSGMAENVNGEMMYPYHIESESISASQIDENTKLYIGIRQQNGLFDIDFEIINEGE